MSALILGLAQDQRRSENLPRLESLPCMANYLCQAFETSAIGSLKNFHEITKRKPSSTVAY